MHQSHFHFWLGVLAVVFGLVISQPVYAADQLPGDGVPWWTADAGGVSSGGVYVLRGAAGQPDASPTGASGGAYALGGGFWRTAPNQAPVVDAIGDQNYHANADVALQVVAHDPEGGPLRYSAAGLPAGLTIDAATGLISGRPAESSLGVHPVTVTATDVRRARGETSFTITVTSPTALPPDDEPLATPGIYLPLVAR